MKAKKLVSLVLAIVMVLGCMTVTAFAGGGGVYYLYPEYNKTDGTFYENCSSGIKAWHEGECNGYYLVQSNDTTWGTTGETTWYVADGQISIANTVTIQGDVRLLLCDGATLTITGSTGAGIDNYGEGNSLTVYAESESSVTGKLIVTGAGSYAGIRSAGGAAVTINGGDVTAYCNDVYGAGIGGNKGEVGSNITVNGGKVTADKGGNESQTAGIGGGYVGNGEYITINGGTVIAGSYKSYGAGIGGGYANPTATLHNGGASYITINGGDVTAKSYLGAAIGSGSNGYTASYITITGGTVNASGFNYGGVGIGGSSNYVYGADFVSAHDIVISGGTVTATSMSGAAIGGQGISETDPETLSSGNPRSRALPAKVYNITISGSDTTVMAKAGSHGAGIGGGGAGCSAENITIKDGATVIATGGYCAAGIGGGGSGNVTNEEAGAFSNADKITISGEGTTVIATGGSSGAGIGAGQWGNASNITITEGAKVYATTTYGSAIGAGKEGSADGITISDGAEVVAVASTETAAIGACYNASNITIDNATVTAKSGEDGTAIGSAKGTATNIVIKGEDTVVTAVTGDKEDIGAEGCGSAIGAGKEGSATGIYVDASLLMVQNNDETLTDDMKICPDRTSTEDVSATVCNKDKCVIVIKPKAYVAQVGTGDNATKYYFVQTAIDKAVDKVIDKIIEEYSISKEGNSYYIGEDASANFEVNQCVELDNITITMLADISEEIDIPSIFAGLYLEEYDWWSNDLGMGGVYFCPSFTLDLNGHVLSSFFDSGESIITNNGVLTLIDSNPTAEHPFTVDDSGLYSWDEDFNSQVSSRLKTDEDGNSFWDDEAEIVTVKGGCITGAARGQIDSSSSKWTIAGVYNEGGTFNMYAGTITGNSGDIGGGVYNAGTMTVGGKAVIEGNTVNGTSTAQNVYLTSGTKITIDNLTEGANIGVTTETKPTAGSPVEFTTNGTKSDEAYFFSDDLSYADSYYNEGSLLNLVLGYRVTAKTADGGTISVGNQKSAYAGETINVTVTPDEGYALDTLAFSGEGIIATNITDKKSFTMPDKEVVITGTFNEATYALSGSATITDGAVTFKKGDDTVTTAKFGDEITVTAKNVDGYTVTLSSDDVTITDGKFTMPGKAVTITATYTAIAYDLTSASSLSGKGGVTFKKDGNAVTTANLGDGITVTAIDVEGYTAEISTTDTMFMGDFFMMPANNVTFTATYTAIDYNLTSASSLSGQGGVTFKKGDATVTTANVGDEITVAATEVEGYTVALSSDDVTITDGTFTMPAKAVTITATYTEEESDNTADMDLNTNNGKEIVVNYTSTQTSESYTDVTKVKIEWTISDISATYKSHKTWDPDTLTWVEVKEDVSATDKGTTFTVTNYSSKDVKATVTFTVETALADTFDKATYNNNECVVKTPVTRDNNTYTDDSFTALKQTIKATLSFKTDGFAKQNEQTATAKYGTYTVTISEAPKQDATVVPPTAKTGLTYTGSPLELVNAGTTNGGTWQYKLNDGTYSAAVPTATNAGTYTVYYKLVGGTSYNDIAEASVKVTVANYLTFTANTAGSTVTPMFLSGSYQYSTNDGKTWTDGTNDGTTTINLENIGDTVIMKGTNCVTNSGNHFAMTGSIVAGGDVTSLTDGIGGDVNLAEAYPDLEETCGCYQYMFYECSALTNAPALPSTVLCDNCYEGMFSSCANLTVAPTLSAKTMAYNCYANMFDGCTSLKTAPELPAKTLAENCYRSMFYNCSALVSAPELPATDLAKNCYCQMFMGCTWLFETPELPATTLPEGCYNSMFAESGIKVITALPEIESYGNDCMSAMFVDCPNLLVQEGGTMPEGGGKIFTCTTEDTSAVDGMFEKSVSPTNGTTYYYQPNNAVYRLEIVLENCNLSDSEIPLRYAVTSTSTISLGKIVKDSTYSFPENAVVTENSGVTTTLTKYSMPAFKNQATLTIDLSGIVSDATITVTATAN